MAAWRSVPVRSACRRLRLLEPPASGGLRPVSQPLSLDCEPGDHQLDEGAAVEVHIATAVRRRCSPTRSPAGPRAWTRACRAPSVLPRGAPGARREGRVEMSEMAVRGQSGAASRVLCSRPIAEKPCSATRVCPCRAVQQPMPCNSVCRTFRPPAPRPRTGSTRFRPATSPRSSTGSPGTGPSGGADRSLRPTVSTG